MTSPSAPLHLVVRGHDSAAVWGCPWPRGALAPDAALRLTGPGGELPLQSWPLATWPDGSLKWTGHATVGLPAEALQLQAFEPVAEALEPVAEALEPVAEALEAPADRITVSDAGDSVRVSSGDRWWVVPRSGPVLLTSAGVRGRDAAGDLTLVSLWQEQQPDDERGGAHRVRCTGVVEQVRVEQSGPVRAVVRLSGRHVADDGERAFSPLRFIVRLAFFAGTPDVRVQHTVVFDEDARGRFLAGLGLTVQVPLSAPAYDRHVRLAGPLQEDGRPGFLTEAVQGITGLRRDPGEEFRRAQVEGRPCGPTEAWDVGVASRLRWVPRWSDWTLDQSTADGFSLRKRTGSAAAWVTIPSATRAAGFAYVGDTASGVGMGMRDFWQSQPTRLDVRDAATDLASLTAWLWSPSQPPLDLRPYHDGLGQETWADQVDALEITYEDYEADFNDATGMARTHELRLFTYPGTPTSGVLADDAAATADPTVVAPTPRHLVSVGVFGDWGLPRRETPLQAGIENLLDDLVTFYRRQVEDRRWYGFLDFGDVMHTYDADRRQWRYDVGGFAWDNSELSPDLWLWLQFLRSGRADVFRLAEAMTRHTSEVDTYHLGRFAGLGSRHNVQHLGCSAKQVRISSAVYRRIPYFLTADERLRDVLDELAEVETTFADLDPNRKVRTDGYQRGGGPVSIGLGTDFSALAAAWFSRWERVGDQRCRDEARDKLLAAMEAIGDFPRGFFSGEGRFDFATRRFLPQGDQVQVSHLSAVFGLVEICSEIIRTVEGTPYDRPAFTRAWLDYCRLYQAPAEEQVEVFGAPLRGNVLEQAHSRLTAWAANRLQDEELARRAWGSFLAPTDGFRREKLDPSAGLATRVVSGPGVLVPVEDEPRLSTNSAAQWGLAAIQNVALLEGPPETTGPGEKA